MMLPIIRDKSHDPFIIYGGLLSRDIVNRELQSITTDDYDLSETIQYTDAIQHYCPSEEFLRKKIAETLLKNVSSKLPKNSQGDIFYNDVVIEVKNNIKELNLENLKGSLKVKNGNRIETAEEELFRYLKKFPKVSWGVLTNGRTFRFYNHSHETNFIEFDLFDIGQCGAEAHAIFFHKLLNDPKYRNELLEQTMHKRQFQSEQELEKKVNTFFATSEGDKFEKTVSCLFFLTIKYLEDIGVLPILSKEYKKYSLENINSYDNCSLIKIMVSFLDGYWFNGEEQPLLNAEETAVIRSFLNKKKNIAALKKLLFTKNKPINLSDIYIDHLGNIYQKHIHNHSEGAYYTPYSIGKKLAEYLTSQRESKRFEFIDNSDKVIVDPACGSGQLLRALVPFSHLFYDFGVSYIPKNSTRRNLIQRMVGVDKDKSSVFICKLGLGLMGAEAGLGLAYPKLVKCEDTLDAFLDSRSNFVEIERENIFAIVTNPPWESLEFNSSNLYRKLTGATLPKKASLRSSDPEKKRAAGKALKLFEKWEKENHSIVEAERKRVDDLIKKCKSISNEHEDYFKGKKNLALYFMFVITKLLEKSNGSYIAVLPDRFLVGDDCPLRNKVMPELEAYVPFQGCGKVFEGVDNGTRFGLIYGRKGKKKKSITVDIPVIENYSPVDFRSVKISKTDLKVGESERTLFGEIDNFTMPLFQNSYDAKLLHHWMMSSSPETGWQQGKINLGTKKGKEEKFGKVGGEGNYKYNITKSKSRSKANNNTYRGIFNISFGATVEKIPPRLIEHYKAFKVVSPNVKRNGVRKIIVDYVKDCAVEHDYNFNMNIEPNQLFSLRSLTYNHLVNILAGSYHINTSVQNVLGTVSLSATAGRSYVETEVELLKQIGFGSQEAVQIISTIFLKDYPNDFIELIYKELDYTFPNQFSRIPDNQLLMPFLRRMNSVENNLFNEQRFSEFENTTRACLAAFVIDKLGSNKKFGRVKLEKALFLLEANGCIDLKSQYVREAAGPLDKAALYDRSFGLEAIAAKKAYFSTKAESAPGRKVNYTPGKNFKDAVSKAKAILSKEKSVSDAEKILEILYNTSTEQSEIIATVFGAWNDLIQLGIDPTDSKIVEEIRFNWHPSKKRFSDQKLKVAIKWLKDKGLVPLGKGPMTLPRSG